MKEEPVDVKFNAEKVNAWQDDSDIEYVDDANAKPKEPDTGIKVISYTRQHDYWIVIEVVII